MRVDILPDKKRPGAFTVIPHGDINSDTAPAFSAQLERVFVSSPRWVILDFAHVDYLSSAGLGVLFSAKKRLTLAGGDLFFLNLKPQIRKLFDIVKALPPGTIFHDAHEADRYFYRIMDEEIKKQQQANSPDARRDQIQ